MDCFSQAVDGLSDLLQQSDSSLELLPREPGQVRGHVLVAEAWNVTPHLETSLEIALRLARTGYQVTYLHYGTRLPSVEFFFRDHFRLKELLCWTLAPQRKGIRLLRELAKRLNLPIFVDSPRRFWFASRFSIPRSCLQSIESLKALSTTAHPGLGLAVASSLVTKTQDPDVTPLEHQGLCHQLAQDFVLSQSILAHAIRRHPYQAVVLFNGRYACVKGAVTACKAAGIPVYYHERGSSSASFSLRTFQPQDRLELQKDIHAAWSSCPPDIDRFAKAQEFFSDKRRGFDRIWTSFTSQQRFGAASPLLESARSRSSSGCLITYFASSDDEVAATDDVYVRDPFEWASQAEALNALAACCSHHGHALIVRCHPHLQQKVPRLRKRWHELNFVDPAFLHCVTIVESGSAISTYELLDGSDVVVSYGSTVGVEAVYWGKPSVLLANSSYDRLASLYQPTERALLDQLLSKPAALTVDPMSASPYGFYMQTYGIAHCLYQPSSLFDGTFCGLKLQTFDQAPLFRLLLLLRQRLVQLLSRSKLFP